jgi:hypothetical protein
MRQGAPRAPRIGKSLFLLRNPGTRSAPPAPRPVLAITGDIVMTDQLPYRQDLWCFVRGLAYDFQTRTGKLVMGDQSCTDMSACMALFKAIDPNVQCIGTFAGDKPDTLYRLRNDEWEAGHIQVQP